MRIPIASTTTGSAREAGSADGHPVSILRREPFRLFFPLGIVLCWVGLGHWPLHALGLLPHYHPVFHSVAQIQGFLMCFAAGFLLTAIPRWTGTPPPTTARVIVALVAPIGTTAFAWFERWGAAQTCWVVMVAMLAPTAWRAARARPVGRPPLPRSLVWLPASLAVGLVGSALVMVGPELGLRYLWVHDLGLLILLQGMFVGFVLGIGPVVLPRIIYGDPASPDAGPLGWPEHATGIFLLLASFWIENAGLARAGYGLRAAVILLYLHATSRLWRRPPIGARQSPSWLAAWLLPLGYLLAAAWPQRGAAGLHVAFIGGFGLMALMVGVQVATSHGGVTDPRYGSRWIWAAGLFVIVALILRVLVDFDPSRFLIWLGAAASMFLVATVLWSIGVGRRLVDRRGR